MKKEEDPDGPRGDETPENKSACPQCNHTTHLRCDGKYEGKVWVVQIYCSDCHYYGPIRRSVDTDHDVLRQDAERFWNEFVRRHGTEEPLNWDGWKNGFPQGMVLSSEK